MDPKKFPKKPEDLWKKKPKGSGIDNLLATAKAMQRSQLKQERAKNARKKRGGRSEPIIMREE